MNENTLIVFPFCLHFCLLRDFEIIRCIANCYSTYFCSSTTEKRKIEKVFWVPEFGQTNRCTGLPNGLDMSLLYHTSWLYSLLVQPVTALVKDCFLALHGQLFPVFSSIFYHCCFLLKLARFDLFSSISEHADIF